MASIHDLVSVTAGAKPQSAESATSPKATTGTTASATGESTASAVSGSAGCPVNINTSDASGLMNLPGIGDSKAAAIVQYRTDHGNFATCDALDAVSGIGPATLQNFAGCCTVK
ncbi:MAG: helix-hairpin-helix domain-containing protein [Myxococcales bacterium]|nr:helix-hairpin-helix domain-containing protein [Myxococcales bacterium]